MVQRFYFFFAIFKKIQKETLWHFQKGEEVFNQSICNQLLFLISSFSTLPDFLFCCNCGICSNCLEYFIMMLCHNGQGMKAAGLFVISKINQSINESINPMSLELKGKEEKKHFNGIASLRYSFPFVPKIHDYCSSFTKLLKILGEKNLWNMIPQFILSNQSQKYC